MFTHAVLSGKRAIKLPTHLCCVIIVVLKLPVFVQKEEDIHFMDVDDLRGGLAYMSTTVMRAVSIESSRLYGTASVCSFFFYKYLLNFLFEGNASTTGGVRGHIRASIIAIY